MKFEIRRDCYWFKWEDGCRTRCLHPSIDGIYPDCSECQLLLVVDKEEEEEEIFVAC